MYIAKPRKKKEIIQSPQPHFHHHHHHYLVIFFSPLSSKMSRTLKEQMGLHPDPHAPEHTMAGGNRLTKVVSRKQYDSQQAGLPTYHRRIAK